MEHKLFVYNTLKRKKEQFVPLNSPYVGMYVCGPTVYGDGHLGHARPAITFDLLFRWLQLSGYKVRYVRNITDVGHLEHDADEGEDKIAKKARLEQKEPMEVVQYYLNRYHKAMEALNVLPPSIEPHASGHIIEQIEFVKKILDAGYAYISDGSVYFDVRKYDRDHKYGILSGRNIDELLETTRALDGQQEKQCAMDFALWKKAQPEHIMRWPSPWSDGFPGWHLECSTMGTKYLGQEFDIHGGGMDLVFPHHECEIAQSTAALGHQSVHYWMHNNMITINGQNVGFSPTMNTDHSVIITVPSEANGFLLGAFVPDLVEEIYIETTHGSCTYPFQVVTSSPYITRIQCEYPRKAGDKLKVVGKNLVSIDKIYLLRHK